MLFCMAKVYPLTVWQASQLHASILLADQWCGFGIPNRQSVSIVATQVQDPVLSNICISWRSLAVRTGHYGIFEHDPDALTFTRPIVSCIRSSPTSTNLSSWNFCYQLAVHTNYSIFHKMHWNSIHASKQRALKSMANNPGDRKSNPTSTTTKTSTRRSRHASQSCTPVLTPRCIEPVLPSRR